MVLNNIFRYLLGRGPERELNGAEDSIYLKTTTAVMEQNIGNMVFTQLEFQVSSDDPL